MRRLRSLLLRIAGLFNRARRDRELAAELEAHLHLHIDDNLRAGMTPEAARRAARIRLGGVEATKDRYRDRRGLPFAEHLIQDVRAALRMMRRNPGFGGVAVVTLALGIGFNTALFTIVDSVLFRPLPVERPDRLVNIYTSTAQGYPYGTNSYADYLDMRARNHEFTDIVGYSPAFIAFRNGERSRLTFGEIVTGNYFQVLGLKTAAGRTLLPDDDRPDAPRAAVISFRLWTREFGANPNAVGQTIRIHGQPYMVVGVASARFSGMFPLVQPEVWIPMAWFGDVDEVGLTNGVPSPGATILDRRGYRWLWLKGRLKEGETLGRATANMETVMRQLATEFPQSNKDTRVTLVNAGEVRLLPDVDRGIKVVSAGLMLIVGLVLLVACANVAGMLLVRAAGRQKEIGIRLALGASRSRLVKQLLTESLLMSSAGAGAGMGLAWLLLRPFVSSSLPIPIPVTVALVLDRRVLFFSVALSLAAGAIAGLVPALKATKPDVLGEISGYASTVTARGRRWTVRDVLVAGQIAVTLVLLVLTGLLARSLVRLQSVDVGFRHEGVAAVSIATNVIGYTDEQSRRFFDRAIERVRALPGVQSAALTWRLPLELNFDEERILIPGHDAPADKGTPTELTSVSPDYFSTIGVPLLEGRAFTTSDTRTSPGVAIVNQTMARRYWPNQSAVGKRVRLRAWDGPQFEVVGVSADYKVRTVGERPTSYIHFAAAQGRLAFVLIAHSSGNAEVLAATIRRELLVMEPDLLFAEGAQTLEARTITALLPARAAASGVGTVGLIAMGLAAIGLYGVIAYSVAQRTREIGLRMALGARRGAVMSLVMRQGLTVVGAGLAVGAVFGFGAARLISGVLYGISPADPLAWAGGVAVLVGSSILANAVPALRAARVEPSVALRHE